ncbi:MAG: diguanylate cyclase [Thiolinea sp.]
MAGDLLLVDFSRILVDTIAMGGIVSRTGGDEFSIIIFSSEKAIYQPCFWKISDKVKSIEMESSIGMHMSTSMGVALFPDDSRDLDQLVAFSDAAMYENKRKRLRHTIFI